MAAILAGVTLTGCGVPDRSPAAPVAARDLTRAEDLRVSDAEQRLVKRCMNRQGFHYWEWHPLTQEESRPVGYVQDDVAWAREHGYGSRIDAKATWARLHNPNGAYRRSLSGERGRAYDQALDGGPDTPVLTAEVPGGGTIRRKAGGCTGEAEERLCGDLKTWFRADKVADNLRLLYVPELMRDQLFRTALRRWSVGMRQASHPYDDPGEAQEAAREGTRGRTGKAFERGVQGREGHRGGRCRLRPCNLAQVRRAREAHYIEKLTDRYGDELATHRRLPWQALARAQKFVGPRP
ncbi:hypothetical protein [Streptomyces sp. NPDC047043]|uniref:hypothetical protein n=1 Tax=Streptomyces sp. NPDC047043 TaxID=3154497 RepID=UPI0033F946F3